MAVITRDDLENKFRQVAGGRPSAPTRSVLVFRRRTAR